VDVLGGGIDKYTWKKGNEEILFWLTKAGEGE
jgi:hypothetical protein